MKKTPNVGAESAGRVLRKRRAPQDISKLFEGLREGNSAALSKAITLIESTSGNHREQAERLIEACMPFANSAYRIGITGTPGAGKSSFIEVFGTHLTSLGEKLAVLAVDPSSSLTHGSILGDKTRMQQLSRNSNAFVRPSPAGDSLGGVARKTREAIILCEAAGYTTVIVETVGVGQSEIAVHGMVDFFLLLKIAGAGDELQGIKRGIIEMADLVVINKADGENLKAAQLAQADFKRALHLYPPKFVDWQTEVLLCSAKEDQGIDTILKHVNAYKAYSQEAGHFMERRRLQNTFWLMQTIEDHLREHFFESPQIKIALQEQGKLVEEGKRSPFSAAEYLLNLYKSIKPVN